MIPDKTKLSLVDSAEKDFISSYLEYTSKTECPTFFHRWTAITSLAAYLGRRSFFLHGHFTLHPNLYVMLIGSPGTKKSSAIKIGAKLLKSAGYTTFAAKKTRQEKFLVDLADQSMQKDIADGGDITQGYDILEENLWGGSIDSVDSYTHKPPAECFVAADEFNNFIGIGNMDFISLLGELWDYEGVYDHKLKNSKSVYVPNPTVSILGGNTPTGFAEAFPTQSLGQGFFSRLLLVFAESTGVKYTFPPIPSIDIQNNLVSLLHKIKTDVHGEMTMSDEARELLDAIYLSWPGIDDIRFEHYANRRLTHLLKLCMVVAAARVTNLIELKDVIYANTLLSFTEKLMPKALGEFGKSKNSAVAHKVMVALDNTDHPMTVQEIWKAVHQDLDKVGQLVEIMGNLTVAEKVQVVDKGYLPLKKIKDVTLGGSVDWNLLTKEEQDLI